MSSHTSSHTSSPQYLPVPQRRRRRVAASLLALLAGLGAATVPAALGASAHAEAAPHITVKVTVPPPVTTLWHNGPTTLTLDVTSPDGPIGTDSAVTVQVRDGGTTATQLQPGRNTVQVGEGVNTVSWRATNPFTHATEAEGQVVVRVDATKPTITVTEGPEPRSTLQQDAVVRVAYDCADALSGLTSCVARSGQGPDITSRDFLLDTSTPGVHALTLSSEDGAQNVTSRSLLYWVVGPDTTAPTVTRALQTGEQGDNGWFTTVPTFRFAAEDPVVADHTTSGLEALDTDLDGEVTEVTTPTTQVTVPAGRHTLKWAARDTAGNASGIGSASVDVDLEDPTTTSTYPSDEQHLTAGSSSTPLFSCDDATSGVAGCYTVVDDVRRDTLDLTPGRHLVAFVAVDRSGRSSASTRSYVVDEAPAVVPSSTTLSRVAASSTRAGSARVVVRSATAPAGKVVVLDGTKRLVRSVVRATDAANGRTVLTVRLPALRRGTHVLRARYSGSDTVRRSTSAPRSVTVR